MYNELFTGTLYARQTYWRVDFTIDKTLIRRNLLRVSLFLHFAENRKKVRPGEMRSRSLWVPCQCIIMVITSAHVVVPLNKHKCLIQRLCIIHPTLTFKVRRKLLSLFPYQPNVAGIMPRNSVIFFFFFYTWHIF